MPEIQVKDKLITLEELGTAINAKAGVTSVNSQTGAVSITPANIRAVAVGADTSDASIQQSAALNFPVQIWSHGDLGRYVFSIAKNGGLFLYDEDLGGDIWTLNIPVTVGQGGTGATTAADARTNLEITPANIGIIVETIQIQFPANQDYVYVSHKDGYNLVQAITMPNNSNTYISGIVDSHSTGWWTLFVSNPPTSTATYSMKLCWVKE